MYGSLDISTSGMVAQRMRLHAIAANIANQDAIVDENGALNPYREREVMFAPGDPNGSSPLSRQFGVHVVDIQESQAEFPLKWDPGHPFAYKDGPKAGYVPMPNVDFFKQVVNQMEAARAYEANVSAAEASKAMTSAALRLLA